MESVLQKSKCCLLCKTALNLHCHHVFEGSNRQNSEKYGMKVFLCAAHHNMSDYSVHMDETLNHRLKRWSQKKAMKYYKWAEEDFRKIFHRSYL